MKKDDKEKDITENIETSDYKIVVIDIFRDKYSNKIYKLGDILDISKERLNEINSRHIYIKKMSTEEFEKYIENLKEKVEE